jgi:hypothetical protein
VVNLNIDDRQGVDEHMFFHNWASILVHLPPLATIGPATISKIAPCRLPYSPHGSLGEYWWPFLAKPPFSLHFGANPDPIPWSHPTTSTQFRHTAPCAPNCSISQRNSHSNCPFFFGAKLLFPLPLDSAHRDVFPHPFPTSLRCRAQSTPTHLLTPFFLSGLLVPQTPPPKIT